MGAAHRLRGGRRLAGHVRLARQRLAGAAEEPTLALRIASALAASGLPPSRLEIEITEAVLIRDDETALAILHQLRAIGVRIALDDFGTGYSSLSYLKRFPFDKIKIDRCFVGDIAEADGSSAIVQAVVNIAAARNMTTTAEGVETEQQKELLRALGCTQMQGFLFRGAKPGAEVRKLFGPSADDVRGGGRDGTMPPGPRSSERAEDVAHTPMPCGCCSIWWCRPS